MTKIPQIGMGLLGVTFVAFLVLALGLVGRSDQVIADEVDSSANLVGGTGALLDIECKWELPDMTETTVAMSYGTPVQDDDVPTVDATAPACNPPAMASSFRHRMMQITPNADDQPIERQYEKWVAIQSTNIQDISDVFFKVWEPFVASPPFGGAANTAKCTEPVTFADDNGTGPRAPFCFKYQHHATGNLLPPTDSNPLVKVSCTDLQSAALTAMFNAAKNTNQMTAAEQVMIIGECFQNKKAIYRVQETISKEQPCGEYRVEVTAVNGAGASFSNVDFFDVICTVVLQRDFSAINWGPILNNQDTVISGDVNFGSGGPTVRNVGNAPMFVEIQYEPLVLTADPTKTIRRFDAALRAAWRTDPSTITHINPLAALDWYCFGAHPIGSNQNAKIDFSVHPENAQAGAYTGDVNIVVRFDCATPHVATHTAGHP